MRLTSPGSARGAGGVHLAQKQLGSAVLFGRGGRGQLDLSTAACWRGPDSLARCGAANGLVKRLSRERLAISPAARAPIPHFASPDLLRSQDVQKLPGRTCHSSPRVRGKPGLERERGWPLSGPDCPVPGRAAWKSPGLGGVGNGFLASQPNCSTFWTVSPSLAAVAPDQN